ncbi:MAG: hypothetical protein JF615_07160 [Asticcacaulis sp.]|nr:hypothetical protein [Asticcacaulis sp.]
MASLQQHHTEHSHRNHRGLWIGLAVVVALLLVWWSAAAINRSSTESVMSGTETQQNNTNGAFDNTTAKGTSDHRGLEGDSEAPARGKVSVPASEVRSNSQP